MVEITVGIEGMACGMCEAHINEAVRNAFKVKKVSSSHTKKRTVIIAEQIYRNRNCADTGLYLVLPFKESQDFRKRGYGGIQGLSVPYQAVLHRDVVWSACLLAGLLVMIF